MKLNRFAIYAWSVLVVTIFVILWGAVVRATGSGAGCGSHWPLCNGEVIPPTHAMETFIEFTHRLTSGVVILMTLVLLVWAFRAYPKGHRVRWGAALSMAFMTIEALIGAVLVVFELTAYNDSTARAIVIALHLVNTFILLAFLTVTAWWASGGRPVQLKQQGWLGTGLWIGFVGMLILGASGAVTALGDTLYPISTLGDNWREELSASAQLLVSLRVYHPIIAVVIGAYLVGVSWMAYRTHPEKLVKRFAYSFTNLYILQLGIGLLNVYLMAPVWMQLVHLFFSDVMLIVLVLFMAEVFATEEETVPVSSSAMPSLQSSAK